MFYRRRDACKVADGAYAGIQVQNLPQGDVERANASTDRRGQGPLDGDEVLANGFEGIVREPLVESVFCLFPCEHLEPHDLPRIPVGMPDGMVEDMLRGGPYIRSYAVAFDEWNDGPVRHVQSALLHRNGLAFGRRDQVGVCGHVVRELKGV